MKWLHDIFYKIWFWREVEAMWDRLAGMVQRKEIVKFDITSVDEEAGKISVSVCPVKGVSQIELKFDVPEKQDD